MMWPEIPERARAGPISLVRPVRKVAMARQMLDRRGVCQRAATAAGTHGRPRD